MDIPTGTLLRAVTKKRARGELGGGQRTPAPKRPSVRAPGPPEAGSSVPPALTGLPVAPEVDLTADTPPEEAAAVGTPRGEAAMERPAAPEGPVTETVVAEGLVVEEPLAAGRSTPPAENRSWGEGPSGASPPRERAPTSSPRARSEQGGGSEGSGSRRRVSPEPFRIDGRWAEQTLSPLYAPEIIEELSRFNLSTFFRESCASLAMLANFLKVARDAIQEGRGLVRESRREASEARERAAVAEGLVETSANHLRDSLARTAAAESTVLARDLRISELASAMQTAEDRAAEATERARAEGERANAAEERVKMEEEKARAAEAGVLAAEERVKAAKEEADRAQEAARVAEATLAAERGARAVEVEAAVAARSAGLIDEYKASERFVNDLAEASASVFYKGFLHCREKVARDLDLPRVLEVEPDDLDSDEPAPTEP